MLIDDVEIIVKAGNGGNGAVAFHPMRGGPSGGNGGRGGDVYIVGVDDLDALSQFGYKKDFEAESGEPGGRQDKDGKNGQDLYLKVPVGTRIAVNDSGWIHEVTAVDNPFKAARGGEGGLGNDEFKTPINQTPRYAQKGKPGQEKKVHLQLRLIADIGFVGLPNAGKSSLLEVLTNAHPKIGDYPFTTLEPNLGAMDNLILADIPGLIEGASSGKGLGIKFLKHIEKTALIAHCIDISQEDLVGIYKTVREEFEKYNPEILDKEEIIVLTKTDLLEKKEVDKKIREVSGLKRKVVAVSILDEASLDILREQLRRKKDIIREEVSGNK